ncbi:unnamed protein product [Euphydryas editha]|uniref:Gem-associated protein 7 n=1 Tax=Euphydryas editha TaxID=104508 RepID=A0AAU9V364_EUPED|nr:unnamed protein product [Euphydryas editha]
MISESESVLPQEARAQLRETFLRAMNELKGEQCQILTYEHSKLEGTFSGWKPDGTEIIVQDLKTPANIKMSSALIRTPDIITMTFEKCLELPFQ